MTVIRKRTINSKLKHTSSFRDPSGFVFVRDGVVYRQINSVYFQNYNELIDSGLYDDLVKRGLLVSHDVEEEHASHIVIKPVQIEFFSYPYEWCFSQLKDAGIATLEIQLLALENGMSLKDATAFNVAFRDNFPIFFDTLSFEKYQDGEPWVGYGQFCRHFLCPLLLWRYGLRTSWNLGQIDLDGSDLELTSKLLPLRTYLNPSILTNVHLHAKAVNKYNSRENKNSVKSAGQIKKVTKKNLINIVKSLILILQELELQVDDDSSEWSGYYSFTNYDRYDFQLKENTVLRWVNENKYSKLWDVGANDGHFSRLIDTGQCDIYSSDYDTFATESNYLRCKESGDKNIVPFVANMVEPSPGLGFANKERIPLLKRIESLDLDCIISLAIIHHLSISANCEFSMLAGLWSGLAKNLIVEFVDPSDSWAANLLQQKGNNVELFDWYNRENFEEQFSAYYKTTAKIELSSGKRTLYHMSRIISVTNVE